MTDGGWDWNLVEESRLIAGVAFKKTFSYAGFEMQRKKYLKPKIALLNVELELKAEKANAEVRVDSVEEYQNIVDAEWTILYDKLDAIVQSGAKVVLSKLPIGDVATQYFADRCYDCGRLTLVQHEGLPVTVLVTNLPVILSRPGTIPIESWSFVCLHGKLLIPALVLGTDI
ncbi:hypothetical protein BSL78_12285 [Apostichopus japonicus]|uniref:CCT-eta n=1 Tax=Stichopus japonicus TaxID=307972 RepID=A0A2G8KS41_STIJA|nr:hypothetical protein BSL78_12285 [Apostichopus japonicus]